MIIWQIIRFIIVKFLEPIYFSLFLIIGKNLKNKRILLTCIMIFEYLMLTSLIKYNVALQFMYTFMSFVNLKVLYKEKAQITDIFLFTAASIILIIISFLMFFIHIYTYNNYDIALILNRIITFAFLYFGRNKIRELYKKFYLNWNRHNNPKAIKSLTLRNISIIAFNLMFWIINSGMVYANIVKNIAK